MKKKIKILLILLSIVGNILLIYKLINPYDVNLDGKVNSKDILDLKRYLLR